MIKVPGTFMTIVLLLGAPDAVISPIIVIVPVEFITRDPVLLIEPVVKKDELNDTESDPVTINNVPDAEKIPLELVILIPLVEINVPSPNTEPVGEFCNDLTDIF